MKHRLFKRIAATVMAASCLLGCCVVQASAATFSDVLSSDWYYEPINNITTYLPGTFSGYPDGNFHPKDTLSRGAFCTMVWKCMQEGMETVNVSVTGAHHWAYEYWLLLYKNGLLLVDYNAMMEKGTGTDADMSNPDITVFDGTSASLSQPITRYEMSVIIANATTAGINRENRATVTKPSDHITDYVNIPVNYRDAVEQVYAKGIIVGDTSSNFNGSDNLTRGSAAWVIYKLLWAGKRTPNDWSKVEENALATFPSYTASQSFAWRYRNMSDAERRIQLFGDANKSYFTSESDASGHMTTITIPAWYYSASGDTTRFWYLTVNTVLVEEVQNIFDEIYQAGLNDPSQRFYINSIGGARYTDTLRHSWGAAIDINPNENYYCRISNGYATALCGQGWWPDSNIYSIKPNGIVVTTFAKYGWGWGGQGWGGGYHDYMHFSIRADGG